ERGGGRAGGRTLRERQDDRAGAAVGGELRSGDRRAEDEAQARDLGGRDAGREGRGRGEGALDPGTGDVDVDADAVGAGREDDGAEAREVDRVEEVAGGRRVGRDEQAERLGLRVRRVARGQFESRRLADLELRGRRRPGRGRGRGD